MTPVQLSVLFFALVVLVAHVLRPAGYDWKRDTVSRLAMPGHRFAWVLRLGMVAYGGSLAVATLAQGFPESLVGLYGAGVLAAGLAPVAPPDSDSSAARLLERIHLVGIYGAGAFLIAAIAWRLVLSDTWRSMGLHAGVVLAVLGLEGGFQLSNRRAEGRNSGVFQRGLHLSTLVWLFAAHS